MADPVSKSSIADNKTAFADYQPLQGGISFKDRLQEALNEKGWKSADLARISGVPAKRISDYLKGPKVASAEYLFPMAAALDVSAEWLALGRRPSSSAVVDASDAEWVSVPFFDLREVTDTGKGPPIEWTPFRKDWLNRTLGTAAELYLVRMLADYRSRNGERDLYEGDMVFCREIEPVELIDGYVCIFRIGGGLKVARYSVRERELMDEDIVTSGEVSPEQFVPVARILGKFVQRI